MALKFNEGKACDAVLRYIETRDGATRVKLRFPETIGHPAPVELVCEIGGRTYAVEHTGIEPFTGYLQLNAEAARHWDPIKVAVEDALPPSEHIELLVPVGAMLGRKMREVRLIQTVLANWIKQTAPNVPIAPYGRYAPSIQPVSVPGVPFPVTLHRWPIRRFQGRFAIRHHIADDGGTARTSRIRKACDGKFDKLAAWKRDAGARTVLVLEENDIQLTNHVIVADIYIPLARARADRPDETYLVSTCTDTWYAWPILIDDRTLIDFADGDEPPGWEIDPRELVSATARPC